MRSITTDGDPARRLTIGGLLALFFIASLAMAPATPGAGEDCPGNILYHPDFEGGSYQHYGIGELQIANGWWPWWHEGSSQETTQGYLRRPEYKMEDSQIFGARRVHSGRYAQKFFNNFATHDAGLWELLDAVPGATYEFSVWVQTWSSEADDPDTIVNHGNYRVSIGVDPTESLDPDEVIDQFNPDLYDFIIWSPEPAPSAVYNTWYKLTIRFQAKSDDVYVFLRGRPEWRVKHNDSYWDDACLRIVSGSGAPTKTPTLNPTRTSTPTITITPIYTATPTVTPTATQTSTPTIIPTSTATSTFTPTATETLPASPSPSSTSTPISLLPPTPSPAAAGPDFIGANLPIIVGLLAVGLILGLATGYGLFRKG